MWGGGGAWALQGMPAWQRGAPLHRAAICTQNKAHTCRLASLALQEGVCLSLDVILCSVPLGSGHTRRSGLGLAMLSGAVAPHTWPRVSSFFTHPRSPRSCPLPLRYCSVTYCQDTALSSPEPSERASTLVSCLFPAPLPWGQGLVLFCPLWRVRPPRCHPRTSRL